MAFLSTLAAIIAHPVTQGITTVTNLASFGMNIAELNNQSEIKEQISGVASEVRHNQDILLAMGKRQKETSEKVGVMYDAFASINDDVLPQPVQPQPQPVYQQPVQPQPVYQQPVQPQAQGEVDALRQELALLKAQLAANAGGGNSVTITAPVATPATPTTPPTSIPPTTTTATPPTTPPATTTTIPTTAIAAILEKAIAEAIAEEIANSATPPTTTTTTPPTTTTTTTPPTTTTAPPTAPPTVPPTTTAPPADK